MDTDFWFKMKNKKALSTVIATVLLILLVTVATAVVWTFVKNIVNKDKLDKEKSCFDVESSEKVTLNGYYTCYNQTSGEVQFSISIADADIDSLVVSILVGGNSRSFTLTNNITHNSDLKPYKGAYNGSIILPVKNAGKTYVGKGFENQSKVDWIKIAPVIDDKQCGESDSTYEVVYCSNLENN
jgi:hypothetical protein